MNKIVIIISIILLIAGIFFAYRYLGGTIMLGLIICITVLCGTFFLFSFAKGLNIIKK